MRPPRVARKREVHRRGWGTAAVTFGHVASDLATAGEERGSKPGSELGGGVALPWASPRMWGERGEYSQWGCLRSIRSAGQWRCGKPNPEISGGGHRGDGRGALVGVNRVT